MNAFKIVIAIQLLAFASAFEIQDSWADIRSNIDTSFSCEGRSYGYYADYANQCQL